jgi:hypothetical protein
MRLLSILRKDILLILEAISALALAHVLTGWLPLRIGLRLAGLRLVAVNEARPDALSHVEAALAVGRRIGRAARKMPFRAECLQQAIACAIMLRLRGAKANICIGVAKNSAGILEAHAWTICGDTILTGNDGHERFSVLAVYEM